MFRLRSLELSAEVKTWLFKAQVSASIVDVMFGSQHSGTFVMNSDRTGYHVEAGDENGLGLFVEFKPTLNVNVGWFHNSFRLFTVDVKPLWIMHQAPVSADRPMVDVQDVTTSAGPATLYSDALVMKDAKSALVRIPPRRAAVPALGARGRPRRGTSP